MKIRQGQNINQTQKYYFEKNQKNTNTSHFHNVSLDTSGTKVKSGNLKEEDGHKKLSSKVIKEIFSKDI